MGLYQAWGVKSGSGVCAGCGAQWLGRGWVATESTIGVAWVNGHHPDFLSTWICQLKQLSDTTTDLTENKKARTKKTFEDMLNILIATLGNLGRRQHQENIADTSDTTLKVRQQLL